MTSDVTTIFAPRIIAQARRLHALVFRRQLRIAVRGIMNGLVALKAYVARSAYFHRELELLMHADDRMLADIGLSRFDVVSAAQSRSGWRGRRDALQAAAIRRDEAAAVARSRRAGLPLTAAPSLAPVLPHAMETANFR
jgi:uncharacterized protein YjiS (DUF1127 family)